MSYWAGTGLDQFAPQSKTTQPTGATAPWTERIQRAPESYGGNGVDSPVVGGEGQKKEDNRFNGKAVEQEGKASAEQHAPQDSVSLRMMKTNDVLSRHQESEHNTSNNPHHRMSNQASTTNTYIGAPPTGQAAAGNDILAQRQVGVLPFDEQNTSNNAYLGVSSQASIIETTIGAPPTGQAAANHKSDQQSPS